MAVDADNGSDGITLNLFKSSQRNEGQRQRNVVRGNRGERIKQRRTLKRRAEHFDYDEEPEVATGHNPKRVKLISGAGTPNRERSPHSADELPKGGGGGGGGAAAAPKAKRRSNASSGQVISSLFKNNPEIPVIESSRFKTIKEPIFSSDAFADAGLHPHLVACLESRLGVQRMTLVQQRAMPAVMAGRDALIKSQTGSGKTLAYALPVVQALRDLERPRLCRSDGVHALVLVPTRELGLQTLQVFQHLLQASVWIVAGCVIGGEGKKAEKARLRKGINILVATPGRLLDHLQHTACLALGRVRWVVIDEADRLLDLGFEKDVTRVLEAIDAATAAGGGGRQADSAAAPSSRSRRRQTVLLSATLTAGVQRLAQLALHDPCTVDVTSDASTGVGGKEPASASGGVPADSKFAIPEKLRQHFVVCPGKLRLVCLASFLLGKCVHEAQQHKIIVFMSTQDVVEFHYTLFKCVLNRANAAAGDGDTSDDADDDMPSSAERLQLFSLHGDMVQKERTKAFHDFTNSRSGILLCTDVAARGLDLPHVDWIVQHSAPPSVEDYVHRVGRTARIGSSGNALLFLMPSEADYIGVLNAHKMRLTEINHEDILTNLMLESQNLCGRGRKEHPSSLAECATALQQMFEEHVYSDKDALALSKKAYRSFIRAYATYPASLKSIFHVRMLHLGHVAKCFCLRDAPTQLTVPLKKHKRHGQRSAVTMKHKPNKKGKQRKRDPGSELLQLS